MPKALLRISKSKAAWEEGDVEQILKTNFRLRDGNWDLEPSVYEISEPRDEDYERSSLRAHVEHVASFLGPPANPSLHRLDAEGITADVTASPGQTRFQFANLAHREIRLDGEASLRALVQQLLDEVASRGVPVAIADVLDYILSVADGLEWSDAATSDSRVSAWVQYARRRAPK